jgi:ribosomal protein L7/L12
VNHYHIGIAKFSNRMEMVRTFHMADDKLIPGFVQQAMESGDLIEVTVYKRLVVEGDTRLTEEEKILAKADKRIACIKSIRFRTGLGLREAKEAMDYYLYFEKEV